MKKLLLILILIPLFAWVVYACDCNCCKRGSGQAMAMSESTAAKAKDPVCGMEVDTAKALKSEYKNKTYYFCSKACKDKFDKNPAEYAAKTE